MTDVPNRAPVALVTGSSRGIGLAIAQALAADGFSVALNCSNEGGLERLQQQAQAIAQQFGVATAALASNVAVADEAKALVEATVAQLGGLDVLVNNAGITRDGLAMRMAPEDFDAVVDVNLKGAFYCAKAVMRPMTKQRSGRIINMSSVSGVYGNPGQANYAASKAGVIGLTKALAKELARKGVTVNAIAPGFIETDMTAALSDDQKAHAQERIAAGRLGQPEDVAALAAFLASDEAAYITGQVICVDGGLSL